MEDAVIATVHCGGDTDTNAAICGALLGSVHGREAVPQQGAEAIAACRATPERSRQPRPTEYWPHDALELADRLVQACTTTNETREEHARSTGR